MPYRRTRPLKVTPESPQINWGDSVNRGLVAYYPCNEPGGLKVCCAVNPAQNLTLSSGYTSRLSGPGGALGRGIKFTNATQYAQGALVKAVTGGPCTVACWITIDAMPSLSAILVALGSSTATDVEYITYIYANNLNWGHSADDLQPSTAPVSAGQRVFVVGSTGSSKQQSIYRNGWLAGTRTATAFPTVSTTVTLGGQYNANTGNNFVGSIDNVRIYNRALSQSEVTRLYQEPLAGVVSPRRRTVGAVISVSGATGTIAAKAPSPTGAASGKIGVSGTATATAPNPSGAVAGKAGVTGVAAAAALRPTAAIAGRVGVTGAAAATAPKPVAAVAARAGVTGTVATTISKPAASITGNVGAGISGTALATSPKPGAAIAGKVGATGTVAKTIAKPISAVVGNVGVTGTAAVTALKPTASVSGRVGVTGAAAVTIPQPTAAIAGHAGIIMPGRVRFLAADLRGMPLQADNRAAIVTADLRILVIPCDN